MSTSSENEPARDTTKRIGAEDFFATTHWTAVLTAGKRNTAESDVALEELCRTYWYPLYAYVRRRGYSREDAEDLTQGFFERLLRRNYLESVDSSKGKFRAFLLASLKHFLANEWDRSQRQKRGGGAPVLSLNWQEAETKYQCEPVDEVSPDKLFDRAWAITLLEKVIERLRLETETEGKRALFEQLRQVLTIDGDSIPYAQLSAESGTNVTLLRVWAHRLRRRYRDLLRFEISQTLMNPEQTEEEVKALFAAFA